MRNSGRILHGFNQPRIDGLPRKLRDRHHEFYSATVKLGTVPFGICMVRQRKAAAANIKKGIKWMTRSPETQLSLNGELPFDLFDRELRDFVRSGNLVRSGPIVSISRQDIVESAIVVSCRRQKASAAESKRRLFSTIGWALTFCLIFLMKKKRKKRRMLEDIFFEGTIRKVYFS